MQINENFSAENVNSARLYSNVVNSDSALVEPFPRIYVRSILQLAPN